MELNKILLIGNLGITAEVDFGLFRIGTCWLSSDIWKVSNPSLGPSMWEVKDWTYLEKKTDN